VLVTATIELEFKRHIILIIKLRCVVQSVFRVPELEITY